MGLPGAERHFRLVGCGALTPLTDLLKGDVLLTTDLENLTVSLCFKEGNRWPTGK